MRLQVDASSPASATIQHGDYSPTSRLHRLCSLPERLFHFLLRAVLLDIARRHHRLRSTVRIPPLPDRKGHLASIWLQLELVVGAVRFVDFAVVVPASANLLLLVLVLRVNRLAPISGWIGELLSRIACDGAGDVLAE